MTRAPALLTALLLGVFAQLVPAPQAQALEGLEKGASATVKEVIDGDTLLLTAPVLGATEVRLVGIQAPKIPLGRTGFRPWPLGRDAKRTLAGLAEGKRVTLHFGGTKLDRHGRLLAHVETAEGLWLQKELLRQGMARVYSFADNRARVDDLYAFEQSARGEKAGIWSNAFYALRTPDNVLRDIRSFQVVEGTVFATARVKTRVFLNFGRDWKTDFTVLINGKARRLFDAANLDPLSLKGKRIRVRGWLRHWNGPLIEASHPEQIEVLEDDAQ